MLENSIYYSTLYDYYSSLLTEKQRFYFEEYYFQNLTLAEISENQHIIRNEIHKNIKETCLKLEQFEEKFKLLEKSKHIKKIIENIDENIKNKIEEWI